jgi:hypothetical protein
MGGARPLGRVSATPVSGPQSHPQDPKPGDLPLSRPLLPEGVAPVPVAIGWDEGGEGVICQSSSEIAGSPRNLSQEASHRFLMGRTAPGLTDLGRPHEPPPSQRRHSALRRGGSWGSGGRTGPGRQGPGSTGKDPCAMGKVPQRGLSDGKEASLGFSLRDRDRRGVGLEAAIPEGLRNSTAA